jgi:TMEM175 potassium channel family protein
VATAPRHGLSQAQQPEGKRSPHELSLGRLEAFSDGVFAIAITILVLELGVSADAADDMLRAILDEWPSYLAYVTSFLTIGVIWLQHSAITGALRAADATLYRLNLLVLLLVGFLPFPTKLVAEFIHERDAERVAGVFYGLTLMALSLAVTAFVRYAAEHRRLVRDEVEAHEVQAALAHQPSFLLYGIGIAVSVFLPTVGVALYLFTALYLGIPGRTIHRLLWRR